jgi:hypothetical protein
MILCNKSTRLPILAYHIAIIGKDIGLSPEILPVMSISAESFIVFFIKWTPFCFVIKKIKI